MRQYEMLIYEKNFHTFFCVIESDFQAICLFYMITLVWYLCNGEYEDG